MPSRDYKRLDIYYSDFNERIFIKILEIQQHYQGKLIVMQDEFEIKNSSWRASGNGGNGKQKRKAETEN